MKLKVDIKIIILLVIILASFIVLIVLFSSKDNNTTVSEDPPSSNTADTYSAKAFLTNEDKNILLNQEFEVGVWVDGGSENVNATEVSIDFPADKLKFIGFNNDESKFDIIAESTVIGNTITIGKASQKELSGLNNLTKIIFQPLLSGDASLIISDNSVLVSSTSNTNILSEFLELNLTITDTSNE